MTDGLVGRQPHAVDRVRHALEQLLHPCERDGRNRQHWGPGRGGESKAGRTGRHGPLADPRAGDGARVVDLKLVGRRKLLLVRLLKWRPAHEDLEARDAERPDVGRALVVGVPARARSREVLGRAPRDGAEERLGVVLGVPALEGTTGGGQLVRTPGVEEERRTDRGEAKVDEDGDVGGREQDVGRPGRAARRWVSSRSDRRDHARRARNALDVVMGDKVVVQKAHAVDQAAKVLPRLILSRRGGRERSASAVRRPAGRRAQRAPRGTDLVDADRHQPLTVRHRDERVRGRDDERLEVDDGRVPGRERAHDLHLVPAAGGEGAGRGQSEGSRRDSERWDRQGSDTRRRRRSFAPVHELDDELVQGRGRRRRARGKGRKEGRRGEGCKQGVQS